jgi:hypothetical protein
MMKSLLYHQRIGNPVVNLLAGLELRKCTLQAAAETGEARQEDDSF